MIGRIGIFMYLFVSSLWTDGDHNVLDDILAMDDDFDADPDDKKDHTDGKLFCS